MEREIGEIFEVDGVKLKCVDYDHNCKDCYFYGKGMQCVWQKCSSPIREDLKNVMFIQIKE